MHHQNASAGWDRHPEAWWKVVKVPDTSARDEGNGVRLESSRNDRKAVKVIRAEQTS
jgi:hypothetical protein